jgi:DNA processing protein
MRDCYWLAVTGAGRKTDRKGLAGSSETYWSLASSVSDCPIQSNVCSRTQKGPLMADRRHEAAALLALVAHTEDEWYRTAALVDEVGSAIRVVRNDWSGLEHIDRPRAEALASRVTLDDLAAYQDRIATLEAGGVRLITILDEDYPSNLRFVYNPPPFLFVSGSLSPEDDRSVAVVGTRKPHPDGIDQAHRLASDLAREGVTVLSGLARGIDSVAHRAALDAGGRTVAVMGTGIERVYPPENADLAADVLEHGALVSQFWPDAPPTRKTFPMRNVVMSGMGVGTVVIEAGPTSGAKMQARYALDHQKRLFLVESLVLHESWAQKYAQNPLTTVVRSVDDILQVLVSLARPAKQLTLS